MLLLLIMVIEINTNWALKKNAITFDEKRAWCKEHQNLDQLIFYSRMEQMWLGIRGLRLKYLKKMLRLKFPYGWDESPVGRQRIKNTCHRMRERLKKNQDPEDKLYLEAILVLLKRLDPLRSQLGLKRKISPLEMTMKLHDANVLSRLMSTRLKDFRR